MPHRSDRLWRMKTAWPAFQIQDGIKHPMPHTGCGLAHIAAIRKGLENSETCLVLEDDCELLISQDQFFKIVEEIVKESSKYDVVVFAPNFEMRAAGLTDNPTFQAKQVHELCFQAEPTRELTCTHCCLWTRSALPILDEYERILKLDVFLPIDRLLFSNNWNWKFDITFEKGSWTGPKPPKASWNTPTVWIYPHYVVNQALSTLSDNLNEMNIDYGCNTQYKFNEYFDSFKSSTLCPTSKTVRFGINLEYAY